MKKICWSKVSTIAVLVIALGMFAACKGKPKASLTLQKQSFLPGEGITVVYSALPEYDSSAWIGIIPSSVPHGSEAENDRHDITYQYLKKSTSGQKTFRAPTQPGTYDFRMHNTDGNGVEVASITFTVTGPAGEPQPTQQAAPTTPAPEQTAMKKPFNKGDAVMVEWKGSWWPAKVIGLRDGESPYKIHYDGYSNSWDEWVTPHRVKKLAKSN